MEAIIHTAHPGCVNSSSLAEASTICAGRGGFFTTVLSDCGLFAYRACAVLMLTIQSPMHYPNSGAQTMPPLASSSGIQEVMTHTDHTSVACGQIADSGSNAAYGSARLGAILACQSARPSPCERLASTCQLAQEARKLA